MNDKNYNVKESDILNDILINVDPKMFNLNSISDSNGLLSLKSGRKINERSNYELKLDVADFNLNDNDVDDNDNKKGQTKNLNFKLLDKLTNVLGEKLFGKNETLNGRKKNREIKIYYRTNANLSAKTSTPIGPFQKDLLPSTSFKSNIPQIELDKVIRVGHLNESNMDFYFIKINKDFFILFSSISLIIFIAFSLITCLYKLSGTSNNDSYYFCRYHQI